MANIQKTNTRKSTVELVAGINANGTKMEFIAIDGVKIGTMGYSSQKDKEAALKVIQSVVDNSDKTGPALYSEIIDACMVASAMTEEGIEAKDSEEVEVDGVSIIINYETNKAYIAGSGLELKPIADLDDLDYKLPTEAVKALLVERVKVAFLEGGEEDDWED